MSGYALQRARNRIVGLAGQGLDLPTFWRESSAALAPAVPHYMLPCWFTLDPASLLVTSHFQAEVVELPPEWLAHEYFEDDFIKMADVAQSERGPMTLHEATGGDPRRSTSWQLYLEPHGADQELIVALRTRSGDAWGCWGCTARSANRSSRTGSCTSCVRCRRTWRGGPARTARRRGERAGGTRSAGTGGIAG